MDKNFFPGSDKDFAMNSDEEVSDTGEDAEDSAAGKKKQENVLL